ncbi:MAG: aldehyde dehydrogenase [Lysobacteraceae bacterium]|nr:MAG: aldehyde dehydrogenase [Xanthomonadaceae bacterium]
MNLEQRLDSQRKAWQKELPVTAETRIDRLDRAIDLLLENDEKLCDAMAEDFGQRPRVMSQFTDTLPSVKALKHAKKHVRQWMRRERRPMEFPLNLLGGKAWVEYQPKGVVGLICPWNFPVYMAFGPLAGILAAGNRCMIKPSEMTPATSQLMAELIADAFDPDEIDVFCGDASVGQAFSALPFDHMFFTGSTAVGKHIMRAAAENLTPVTLELGGKSPTIIGEGADLTRAAQSIVLGKTMNAGQICLAPDYVYVQEQELNPFLERFSNELNNAFPTEKGTEDYTTIINDRHQQRLAGLVEDAVNAGVEVRSLGPEGASCPVQVAINPPESAAIMREEIFGPLLPVRTYQSLDQVIEYVNANPRPLALYYFGPDRAAHRQLLDRTLSGGATLNDVIFHIAVEDLPFGGTGASGIGHYHGHDGFKTFSHAKAVMQQSPLRIGKLLGILPPYGSRLKTVLKTELRK